MPKYLLPFLHKCVVVDQYLKPLVRFLHLCVGSNLSMDSVAILFKTFAYEIFCNFPVYLKKAGIDSGQPKYCIKSS